MSKKNKRYKVYEYKGGYDYWYFGGIRLHWKNEHASWIEHEFDRSGLILYFAHQRDARLWEFFTDDKDNTPKNLEWVPCIERPGVKSWQSVIHTIYMVTVMQDGEEKPINLTALKNDVEKRKIELKRPRKWNKYLSWKRPPKCWKDQYKCRKQYLIHKGHKDTLHFDRKSYDLSWEDDD